VVDVSNSPSFEDLAVMKFFETSNRNLLPAEKESGYLRAKSAQEKLCRWTGSELPGGYSTRRIPPSLPGKSGSCFVISGVVFASSAISVPDAKHCRINSSFRIFTIEPLVARWSKRATRRCRPDAPLRRPRSFSSV
jgi:hypothetical protein